MASARHDIRLSSIVLLVEASDFLSSLISIEVRHLAVSYYQTVLLTCLAPESVYFFQGFQAITGEVDDIVNNLFVPPNVFSRQFHKNLKALKVKRLVINDQDSVVALELFQTFWFFFIFFICVLNDLTWGLSVDLLFLLVF
jgi:hypothetical protein